jgi:predicted Fe-Mo cluster-binding NifX family protein
MKIAVPLVSGKLSAHFGRCEEFMFIDIDTETKEIKETKTEPAPAHERGLIPEWLAQRGVNAVITGGMGRRAVALLEQFNIKAVSGAPDESPETLAKRFAEGSLKVGDNTCQPGTFRDH